MHDSDREVIEDYCRRAAVSAVADLIREHGHDGQLALTSATPTFVEPWDEPSTPVPIVDIPHERQVTVTPIPEYSSRPRFDPVIIGWRVAQVALVLGAAAVVVFLAIALINAVVAAVAAIVPLLVVVASVIALIALLGRMGGGGGRTGGFSGTWWTH